MQSENGGSISSQDQIQIARDFFERGYIEDAKVVLKNLSESLPAYGPTTLSWRRLYAQIDRIKSDWLPIVGLLLQPDSKPEDLGERLYSIIIKLDSLERRAAIGYFDNLITLYLESQKEAYGKSPSATAVERMEFAYRTSFSFAMRLEESNIEPPVKHLLHRVVQGFHPIIEGPLGLPDDYSVRAFMATHLIARGRFEDASRILGLESGEQRVVDLLFARFGKFQFVPSLVRGYAATQSEIAQDFLEKISRDRWERLLTVIEESVSHPEIAHHIPSDQSLALHSMVNWIRQKVGHAPIVIADENTMEHLLPSGPSFFLPDEIFMLENRRVRWTFWRDTRSGWWSEKEGFRPPAYLGAGESELGHGRDAFSFRQLQGEWVGIDMRASDWKLVVPLKPSRPSGFIFRKNVEELKSHVLPEARRQMGKVRFHVDREGRILSEPSAFVRGDQYVDLWVHGAQVISEVVLPMRIGHTERLVYVTAPESWMHHNVRFAIYDATTPLGGIPPAHLALFFLLAGALWSVWDAPSAAAALFLPASTTQAFRRFQTAA
jgi:hypothetical protein